MANGLRSPQEGVGINSNIVLNGTTLELTHPGDSLTTDLSSLYDNVNNDPVIGNEAINSVKLTASNVLEIDQTGTIFTQGLSSLIADADADSTNGYNTNLSLSNDSLIFDDNGGRLKQGLSSLGGGYWARDASHGYLGTSHPGSFSGPAALRAMEMVMLGFSRMGTL